MAETATFDPAWLALREPADHRSRSAELAEAAGEWLTARRGRRVLDLASGTGSNVRYLAPRLPAGQRWTLVDRDAALLARAADAEPGAAHRVETVRVVCGDLAREGLAEVAGADLVTASALLDLVGAGWLGDLVSACASTGAAALLALSWDGETTWREGRATEQAGANAGADDLAALDRRVNDLVRAHQLRDKGLGPALGPDAPGRAVGAFEDAGYRTLARPSPWRLGPGDAGLVAALVEGWARAATEQAPAEAERIAAWSQARGGAAWDGRSFELVVGHVDVLALPPDT